MVKELERLIEERLSATAIARVMGLSSRNMVLAKAFRLGLSIRGGRERQVRARPPRPAPKPKKELPPRRPEPVPPFSIVPEKPPAACDFRSRNGELAPIPPFELCHWPLGDVRARDYAYCGEPACAEAQAANRSYCAHHWKVMWRPAARRTG